MGEPAQKEAGAGGKGVRDRGGGRKGKREKRREDRTLWSRRRDLEAGSTFMLTNPFLINALAIRIIWSLRFYP